MPAPNPNTIKLHPKPSKPSGPSLRAWHLLCWYQLSMLSQPQFPKLEPKVICIPKNIGGKLQPAVVDRAKAKDTTNFGTLASDSNRRLASNHSIGHQCVYVCMYTCVCGLSLVSSNSAPLRWTDTSMSHSTPGLYSLPNVKIQVSGYCCALGTIKSLVIHGSPHLLKMLRHPLPSLQPRSASS